MSSSVRFERTDPAIPSFHDMYMLEAMTYRAGLRIPPDLSPHRVTVQAWTDQCDKDCPDHQWHAIPLAYTGPAGAPGLHEYATSAVITSDMDFGFTFRFKVDGEEKGKEDGKVDGKADGVEDGAEREWQWRGAYQRDGFARVNSPREADRWTLGPDWDHITGAVHLGNFIAAAGAPEHGFTHVLNVADNRDVVFPAGAGVAYKKVPMADGAHHPIPAERIAEAVAWLREQERGDEVGKTTKILVNCRAGIGRAGSTVVAYVYAINPDMTYEEAYEFVYAKRFVYPHVGLKRILHDLYPRK